MKDETFCFKVTGEFITQQARSFWADEDEPEKALDILRCLDGITDSQCFDVLEGRAKLIGDSSIGVSLAPDEQKLPTLKEVIGKLKRERDEALDGTADALQMLNGDTEAIASPTGRRMVPRRKTKAGKNGRRVLKDGYEWSDIEGADPKDKEPRIYQQSETTFDAVRPLPDSEDESEPSKVKLTPDDKITSNTGWLSPKGEFYGCRYSQHNWVASALNLDPYAMGDDGWIRVAFSDTQWFFTSDRSISTDIQKQMISDYCIDNEIDIPWWITEE